MFFIALLVTFIAAVVTGLVFLGNLMRTSSGKFQGRGIIFVAWLVAVLVWVGWWSPAFGHDHNRADLNPWYQSLKSGRGPCCDGSDHKPLPEVDWEKREGRYWVRVEGQWVVVPDDAVLPGPNLDGRTLVWHFVGTSGIYIRCFAPGLMG